MIQRAQGPQCLGWRRSGLVDGTLTEDVRDRALAHLCACPDCADDVEVERLLVTRLQVLPDPVPSASLIATLLQMGETGGPMAPRPGHVPGSPRPRPVPVAVEDGAAWRRPARPARPGWPSRATRAPRASRPGRPAPGALPVVRRDARRSLEPQQPDRTGSRAARRAVASGAVGLVGAGIFAIAGLAGTLPNDGAGPAAAAAVHRAAPEQAAVGTGMFLRVAADPSGTTVSSAVAGLSGTAGGSAESSGAGSGQPVGPALTHPVSSAVRTWERETARTWTSAAPVISTGVPVLAVHGADGSFGGAR